MMCIHKFLGVMSSHALVSGRPFLIYLKTFAILTAIVYFYQAHVNVKRGKERSEVTTPKAKRSTEMHFRFGGSGSSRPETILALGNLGPNRGFFLGQLGQSVEKFDLWNIM